MVPAPLARIILRASIPRHGLQKPFYREQEPYAFGGAVPLRAILVLLGKVRPGEGLAILVPLSARESQRRAVQKRGFVKHAEKKKIRRGFSASSVVKPTDRIRPSRILGRTSSDMRHVPNS